MHKALSVVLAVAFNCVIFAPVSAQVSAVQCGDYKSVKANLKRKHGETILFTGTFTASYKLVFFANQETRNWTVIGREANGQACVLGIGNNLEMATVDQSKVGAPA